MTEAARTDTTKRIELVIESSDSATITAALGSLTEIARSITATGRDDVTVRLELNGSDEW